MREYELIDDEIIDNRGDIAMVGIPYQKILDGEFDILPENYDGWFPFTRLCNSIGDWGIISGIFSAMKEKYPNIKIAIPNTEYLTTTLTDFNFEGWNYNSDWSIEHNMELIFKNNPNIDYRFSAGEFNTVFTDHQRAYDNLINLNGVIVSDEEPLAEQIVKKYGFTNKDLSKMDLRPKLYFTDDEIQNAKSIVKEYGFDWDNYGCLLLASRLDGHRERWDGDDAIIPYIDKYKNTPVFCYSGWEVNGTFWGDFFPNRVDFSKENIPLRTQLCLKYHAKFNAGYQAGITDSVSGGASDIITLPTNATLRENFIRGVRYVYYKEGKIMGNYISKKSKIYK